LGEPLEPALVRRMLLLKANSLAAGFSGVRPLVVDALLALLNADVVPVIPGQGSVGASGDLAPLAHVALALMGEGEATAYRHTPRTVASVAAQAGRAVKWPGPT
jgi:histidine ammonia-lyase